MNQLSVFLELKNGFCDTRNKKYYYNLFNGEQISFKNPIFLVDPTYDSTFKILFGNIGCEKQLKDFLDAILYPGENESKIDKIRYLTNEFHKFNEIRNNRSLRTDIACEIERDGEIKVVAIEMQKGDRGSLNKRLFNYGTAIRNNNNYKNCISLGISCSSNISSNYVKLEKTSNGIRSFLNYIQTIVINVDKELLNLANNKLIKINEIEIGNDGKEFLKLFGLKSWAIKVGNRYAIPNYKEFKLSTNPTINKCFEILSSFDNEELTEMILDEQYYIDIVNENINYGFNQGKEEGKKEGREEGIKEGREEGLKEGREEGKKEGINLGLNTGLIIGAFSIFEVNSDLQITYNYLRRNGLIMNDESQIRSILNNEDKNKVEQFINNLKILKFL